MKKDPRILFKNEIETKVVSSENNEFNLENIPDSILVKIARKERFDKREKHFQKRHFKY